MKKETDINIDALLRDTFLTVVELRQGTTVRHGMELYRHCQRQVELVRERLKDAGFSRESVEHITYAQCALLDETVLSRGVYRHARHVPGCGGSGRTTAPVRPQYGDSASPGGRKRPLASLERAVRLALAGESEFTVVYLYRRRSSGSNIHRERDARAVDCTIRRTGAQSATLLPAES